MRSIDERLAGADPLSAPYEHPHFDAMLARVVAERVGVRRDAAWRGFRRKVVAAVAATSVLTGAGIAGLSTAGLSLPVLAFASAAHSSAKGQVYGTATPSAAMFMPIQRNWQFHTDGLSADASSGTVFQVTAASDPAASLTRAAAVLGVDLGAPTTVDNGTSFLAAGPLYSGSVVPFGPYASWTISVNDAPPVVSTASGPATDAYNATAVAWTRELTSLDVGAPTATAIGLEGMGSPGPVQVSVPLVVDGHATDFAFDYVFTGNGNLVAANGVDIAVTSVGDYPLLSPVAAAAQIPSQLFLRPFTGDWVAVPVTASSAGSTGWVTPSGSSVAPSTPSTPPSSSDASPPSSTTVPGPEVTTTIPPTIVDLTAVTLSYGLYPMNDGSTLLLPVYVYTGTVAGEGTQTFRVVPIDPSLLNFSFAVTPQIY